MQPDVHDTGRRIERAIHAIQENASLPNAEKKILAFDEYLSAKGIGDKRRLVYLVTLPHLRMMLRRRGEDAKINKHVNPHLFRHSQASELADDLTEAQMNEYFGWKQGLPDVM